MTERTHVAVIGGGAAGLAAAIAAATAGAEVTVFEGAKRVGSTILKTGNGRCNLTNSQVLPFDYHEPFYVTPLIEAYPPDRVLGFFNDLGLLTVEEDDGRIYPFSNSANTVLDVLRSACARLNVRTLCEHRVIDLKAAGDGFEVTCANGTTATADRLVVATGGGTDLLRALGHEIVPYQPVLCPLATETAPLRGLSGVRTHAKVSAYETKDDTEAYAWLFGEVQFRDYGLSGIVIFDISREVDEGDYLGIDFMPQVTIDECIEWLSGKLERMRACADDHNTQAPTYSDLMCGVFHTRLNNAVLRMAQCKLSAPAEAEKIAAIASALKDFRVQITGFADTSKAQVMRGGAAIDEFDQLTLESTLHRGLYAAGECLSVDGRCGGFNLHWAWASGIASGKAAAN